MPETVEISVMHRIRNTPMRDVVRGRLTGRLDVRARVTTGLPADAAELIVRVVRRTRLRAMEKIDVADELVAHFADGLERGASVAELIKEFGDERTAARLIARAKRRGRPVVVRVVDALGWVLAVAVVFYLGLAGWFYFGKPSPKVDYIAELNRQTLATPADQRAWPGYLQAHVETGDIQMVGTEDDASRSILEIKPGDRFWPHVVEWITKQQPALKDAREASKKPVLGFVFGPGGSEEQASMLARFGPPMHFTASGSRPPPMLDAQLLNTLWLLQEMLLEDSLVAVEQHDSRRYIEDIGAMVGMSRHLRSTGILDVAWSGCTHWRWAVAAIRREIYSHPEAFSDADLRDLAHLVAGPAVASDLIDMSNDRSRFYDLVQYMYSDDSRGGGQLTARGLDMMYHDGAFNLQSAPWIGSYVAWPAVLLRGGSRRDAVAEYDRLMDLAEANMRQPRRLVDWSEFSNLPARDRDASPVRGNRLVLAAMLPRDVPRVHDYAERALGERDGTVVGIALEMYRRSHGGYPDVLDKLVPEFLPAVPVDRITGESLHYRVDSGKPIVYSVGFDRKDDGGRLPLYKGEPEAHLAARWEAPPMRVKVEGDWVIYPLIAD